MARSAGYCCCCYPSKPGDMIIGSFAEWTKFIPRHSQPRRSCCHGGVYASPRSEPSAFAGDQSAANSSLAERPAVGGAVMSPASLWKVCPGYCLPPHCREQCCCLCPLFSCCHHRRMHPSLLLPVAALSVLSLPDVPGRCTNFPERPEERAGVAAKARKKLGWMPSSIRC